MLTPQDINEKGFDKAVFNGYDMGDVDDFLETVANDYNALFKENAILKGKLKVLVEKVEEYRSTEDAMRMALLTAQRMGEEITSEASKSREEMLRKTEDEIKTKLGDTEKRLADEETRLALASQETAKFIELSKAIIQKHTDFLSKLETAQRTVKPKSGQRQTMSAPSTSTRAATRPAKPAPAAKVSVPVAAPAPTPVSAPVESPTKAHAPASAESIAKAAVKPIQPSAPAPADSANDFEIDDIAMAISSVVEQIADEEVAPTPPTEVRVNSFDTSPSLFEDDDGAVTLYTPEDELENTSPRPKFDFDDLKFGANFDIDD